MKKIDTYKEANFSLSDTDTRRERNNIFKRQGKRMLFSAKPSLKSEGKLN